MKININFRNRKVRTILKQLLQAGLQAADPILAMKKALSVEGGILRVGRRHYDLTQFDRIVCVGGGKASGKMAIALEQRLGSRLSGGLVAVNDHSGIKTKYIRVVETRHPIPDGRSVRAAKEILTLAQSLTRRKRYEGCAPDSSGMAVPNNFKPPASIATEPRRATQTGSPNAVPTSPTTIAMSATTRA